MREPLTPPLMRSNGSTQRGRKVQAPSLSLAGSACTSLHEVDLGQCSRFAKRLGRKRTRRQNARFLRGNRNGKTTESAKRTFTKSTTHLLNYSSFPEIYYGVQMRQSVMERNCLGFFPAIYSVRFCFFVPQYTTETFVVLASPCKNTSAQDRTCDLLLGSSPLYLLDHCCICLKNCN